MASDLACALSDINIESKKHLKDRLINICENLREVIFLPQSAQSSAEKSLRKSAHSAGNYFLAQKKRCSNLRETSLSPTPDFLLP